MAENSSNTPTDVTSVAVPEQTSVAPAKGKGKAVASEVQDDVKMDDDDDDEEDDDEVAEEASEEDDDNEGDAQGAIDLDNVVPSRTRGKVIDFAKAAEENPVDDEDDEEEDEDFEDDDEMEED